MSYSKLSQIVTVFIAAALLASCGSADSEEFQAATTEATTERALDLSEPESPGAGLTAAIFEMDGTNYTVSCIGANPEALTDSLVSVELLDRTVEVRSLADLGVDEAVAVAIPGGACSAGEAIVSDWSLAYAAGLPTVSASIIACGSGVGAPNC